VYAPPVAQRCSELGRVNADIAGIRTGGEAGYLRIDIQPFSTSHFIGMLTQTRDESSGDYRSGVVETVLNLFGKYNIVRIVADATGIGKEYVEKDLTDLCMKRHGFSDVVAFKLSPESKSPLWFGTVKPAMETGRVKTYMDRDLYLQMRAWRCEFDPSTQSKPRLTPPKAGKVKSDDALIAWFLALWGALSCETDGADAEMVIGHIDPALADGMSAFERASYGL